jgi:hypothetical protein
MSRNIAEPYTYTDIFLAFRALLFLGWYIVCWDYIAMNFVPWFGFGIWHIFPCSRCALPSILSVFSTCALGYMQTELLFMESCAYPDLPLSS